MTAARQQARPAGPARSSAGRDTFWRLLLAEWTKFRTVRGWAVTIVVAALLLAGLGVWAAAGPSNGCQPVINGSPATGSGATPACRPRVPLGPGGETVTDSFYFVRRTLAGDGSITVRVTSLTGSYSPGGGIPAGPGQQITLRAGLQPWAKAGVIITASTRPGSAYAAVLVTGSHGVRMQYDYTRDMAGLPGAVSAARPRWLRLTRTGNTLTGYDSADGVHWTQIGSAVLPLLPGAVRAGLFAASPPHITADSAAPSQATAAFGQVSISGTAAAGGWHGGWRGGQIGGGDEYAQLAGRFREAGGRFSVTGSGDIAPVVAGPMNLGRAPDEGLTGAFGGLIVLIVLGAMFMTAEYRRGLIRTTLAASPRRGRVLAAKAVVIGAVTFAAGLAGATVTVLAGPPLLRRNGNYVIPVSALTQVRVIAGTAALLALAAVLALALGAIMRHSAGPITVAVALIVVPYFFAGPMAVLPSGAAAWLLRVTPAAGFAVEQAVPRYAQVVDVYTAQYGYYPLGPAAGFLVLCGWTAVALAAAALLLRWRDA